LLGLSLFIVTLIPVTAVEEVINTQFTVNPGAKHEAYYHTHIFGKSVLKGEFTIDGENIYLTEYGYNTQHLQNIYVKRQYSSGVDPADDLYTFIFNNTEGRAEGLVRFELEEVWTRP